MKLTIKSLCFIFTFSILIDPDGTNAQMYWNQAASFAGNSSSYAAAPNSFSLNFTGSFTLEAWVNPSNTLNKGVISKGGVKGTSLIYGIRITNSRVVLITNGSPRISSKTTSLIPVNTWTHIATTYDSTSSTFKIYINGLLDTSAVVAAASPHTNTDSVFIGISGTSTPFAGKLDEVRVWNTALSNLTISVLMKSSLGISGDGFFKNLVLSIPFQNNTGTVPYFSSMDFSDKLNNCTARNITAADFKDSPSKNNQISDCAYFSSNSGSAFVAADNPSISPSNKMTIEFWLYPKASIAGLLVKGNGSFYDYGMRILNGKLNAYINNTLITSNDSVKKDRWSHIAFTYFGATGAYEFYINGKLGTTGNISPGNIFDSSDSLYIGILPNVSGMLGFMDELRISNTVKSASEINSQMFTSINESNDNDSYSSAVYNFDASTLPSTTGAPRLNLRGNGFFTFNGAFTSGFVQSPVNNFSQGDFQKGYYLSMPNKRIPETGTAGTIRDTLEIISSETISDLNVFIALNHIAENSLNITLKSPLGVTVDLFANKQLSDFASNIVTVFDSDADSLLISGRYVNFGPKIRPEVDLDAVFSGDNAKGKWVLTISDDFNLDTGFLTSWGIQINNNPSLPFTLECTSLVEGFYNPSTNLMIEDTVRYFLHSVTSPFSLIDSSRGIPDLSGLALISFTKAQPLTDYFLVLKHRNSIETWSSTTVRFSQFAKQSTYNFTDLISRAFENNLTLVDTSPVRFAVYSGDVNQDGSVELGDVVNVFNAANTFTNGYMPSDMDGNNVTDLADVIITFNNSSAFVVKMTP